MRGWYYDIPEIANGNAAKVLANPQVMSGNTLMFYSQNVASSTATGGAASSGAPESCSAATVGGAVTTVNYFDLFTGNPAIDNTITIGDLVFNSNSAGAGHQGNRFQLGGVTNFIPSGADSVWAVGQNISITHTPPASAGRRVGWHIGR
jgi:hypothetical protein